jgi:hypothetical protein
LSGTIVRSVTKLASITFLSLAFSYWIDNLGFITKGRLVAVLIIPSLGVLNWSVIYIINTAPSNAIKAMRTMLAGSLVHFVKLIFHYHIKHGKAWMADMSQTYL